MSEHHHTDHDGDDRPDIDRPGVDRAQHPGAQHPGAQRPGDERGGREEDAERVARIAEDVGAENPDPITRREAIELELEDEGLSEAGETPGEHVE